MANELAEEPAVDNVDHLQRSSRDVTTLPAVLSQWLSTVMPGGVAPEVTVESGVDSNGMSSETIILTGRWTEDGDAQGTEVGGPGGAHRGRRPGLPHLPAGPPVRGDATGRRTHRRPGPAGALAREHRRGARHAVLPDGPRRRHRAARRHALHVRRQLVRRRAAPSSSANCRTPPSRCSPSCTRFPTRTRHSASSPRSTRPATPRCAATSAGSRTGTSSRCPTSAARRWWNGRWPGWRTTSPPRSPHRDPVLVWGDSRIGNVLYQDFRPVAVLDWEMATVGPRELDVAWIIFAHMVFQELAGLAGMPGLPEVLREDDVRATYQRAHRRRSRRPALVLRLLRRDVVLRVHAHRRAPGALRRDREARRCRIAVLPRRTAETPARRGPTECSDRSTSSRYTRFRSRSPGRAPRTATSTTAPTSTPTTAPATSS